MVKKLSFVLGVWVVSRVPGSLVRRESGQTVRFVLSCPRNPRRVE